MVSYIIFSGNPSFGFLWSFLINLSYFYTGNKIDKAFNSIVRDEVENMEDGDQVVNVAVVENKAYWVIDNIFYQADVIDGEIDRTSSRPIDAFDMSRGDLRKMLFILDNLDSLAEG